MIKYSSFIYFLFIPCLAPHMSCICTANLFVFTFLRSICRRRKFQFSLGKVHMKFNEFPNPHFLLQKFSFCKIFEEKILMNIEMISYCYQLRPALVVMREIKNQNLIVYIRLQFYQLNGFYDAKCSHTTHNIQC